MRWLLPPVPPPLPPVKTGLYLGKAYKSQAGAFMGSRGPRTRRRKWTLGELKSFGAWHIKWDGRYVILDTEGHIITVLLGHPEDPDWDSVVCDACKVMAYARRMGYLSGALDLRDAAHRRGHFAIYTSSVSFGGRQKRPGNLVCSAKCQKIINYLLSNKSVRRLVGFQSSGFAQYAPKLERYYVDTLQQLLEHHEGLEHNLTNSIFPAVTFNVGPDVVTDEHADFNNSIHRLCGLTSGKTFDHTRGGHTHGGQLYMKELKLVIDFPSGSSMLILSAFVRHGNTPIQEGETRYSLAQYVAGGLFRWVMYGFQSVKLLLSTASGSNWWRLLTVCLDLGGTLPQSYPQTLDEAPMNSQPAAQGETPLGDLLLLCLKREVLGKGRMTIALKIFLDPSFIDEKRIAAVCAHRPIRVYDRRITEFAARQARRNLLMKQREHARHVPRLLLRLLRHRNIRPGATQVAKALKKLAVSSEGDKEEGEAKARKS
ncbi:hypothetical protein B0H17DRAFT_1324322 [Mycena rosella]|uniref:Uncharacterized protein n=1 Tax=Mycena rosella TaxID=1033263 RepID=A0AAD7MCI8_MYCRO|nr:hypothetical protein B0H17DRAFT_1324322 [Mycena rosella]